MSGNCNIESIRLGLYEVGYSQLSREWNYKQLSSPFSRIYLIEKGSAVVRHSGISYPLEAGDLHLVPCYATTDYECPQSHSQYYTGFTMKLATGTDLFAIKHCEQTIKADEVHYELFRRLTNLIKPFTGKFGRLSHVDLPLAVELEARGIVLQLASAFLRTAKEVSGEAEAERFGPVMQFVGENLQHEIPLETLADLVGLTPTYFSDLFFKTMHCRPVEFVNSRRIERAQLLLGSTDMTVQEISDAVGINSAAYFSRLFHRTAGTTPTKYRKMLRSME